MTLKYGYPTKAVRVQIPLVGNSVAEARMSSAGRPADDVFHYICLICDMSLLLSYSALLVIIIKNYYIGGLPLSPRPGLSAALILTPFHTDRVHDVVPSVTWNIPFPVCCCARASLN